MSATFTSQTQGPENTNPYLAIWPRCKWRCSTPIIRTFNSAAIAKGAAIKNRFVQLLFAVNTGSHRLPETSKRPTQDCVRRISVFRAVKLQKRRVAGD